MPEPMQVKSIADLKLKVGATKTGRRGVEQAIKNAIRVRPRTLSYKASGYGRGYDSWQDSLYDLTEISRAADTESLLSVSFRHHRELLLKEGFTFKSRDAGALRVVRKRIFEIESVSHRSFASVVRDIATDLIKFHTAFLYLRRDPSRSSGGPVRHFTKLLDPIAALEPVDPTTMSAKQNKSGRVIKWKQSIPEQGEEVEFEPDEIIAITMDRKTGFIFGTPFCLPVLDDILTLRRLEELVDVIATKFAFPLVHYKVGTEKMPAQEYTDENGDFYSEVDLVRDTLGDLPTEGSIVTPERHEIIVLGADGNTLNLQPYLEYFRDRVMAGLRLSGVEVGQGDTANRGTAVTITKNMADAVKDYQEVLSDAISFYLLRAILLEEGYDVTEDTMVYMKFYAVDQEELRAKENHAMGLYQGHGITQDEMRERMDMEPMTDKDNQRGYLQLVEIPLIEAKGKIEVEKAKASAALMANKNRPSNQYGKKATKTKVTKNDAVTECWGWAREQVQSGVDVDEAVREALSKIMNIMSGAWKEEMENGAEGALSSEVVDTFFRKVVKKEAQRIEKKVSTMCLALADDVSPLNVLDAMKGSVARVIDGLTIRAKAFGMLHGKDSVVFGGDRYENFKDLAMAIASRRENDE